MIRINLFGEQKDNTPFYILQGLIVGVSVFVTLAACVVVQTGVSADLSLQQEEKARLEQRLAKLKQKTQKVDELEAKKKLLAEKLNTIASLKVKKQGPVHIMDELTKAIPVRAWLMSAAQRNEGIEMSGVAVDPQTVSEFMRKLDESIYFGPVELVYSKGTIKDSVRLQEFAVSAKLTSAGELQKLLAEKQAGMSGTPGVEPAGVPAAPAETKKNS